jgi:hypothetical protein
MLKLTHDCPRGDVPAKEPSMIAYLQLAVLSDTRRTVPEMSSATFLTYICWAATEFATLQRRTVSGKEHMAEWRNYVPATLPAKLATQRLRKSSQNSYRSGNQL